MNTLAFEIIASPSSNDHQVRLRIDGEDWLGDGYLGIDPPHFFAQQSLKSYGELLVGKENALTNAMRFHAERVDLDRPPES